MSLSDCGVSDTPSVHPLVESTVIGMRTACILPQGHALCAKSVIWPEDLATQDIIHTRRDSEFYHLLNEACTSPGVKLTTRIQTRQFTTASLLVASGAGVSVVSEMDAREYAHLGLAIRPLGPDIAHRLALLCPTNARSSLIAMKFLETFEASLAPYRHHQGIQPKDDGRSQGAGRVQPGGSGGASDASSASVTGFKGARMR